MNKLVMYGAAVLLAGFIYGCGGGGSGSNPAPVNANVRGQLILPEAVDLPRFEVYLDTDLDPTIGYIKKDSEICQCQLLVDYFFVDAPQGTYYIHAVVRINSTIDAAPVAGDFVGYYVTDSNPPTTPNVVVTAVGGPLFDFNLVKK